MVYHIFFLLRRLILVLIAFLLQEMPMLQMIVFTEVCLLNLAYITVARPFESNLGNNLEIYNEFMILMIIDVLSTVLGYP